MYVHRDTGGRAVSLAQAISFKMPLRDKSVHCVVTSPPYYSLRKYAGEQEYTFSDGWTGAYGLEPTLQMYIEHTVEWAREVHRVLRDDGTFWLNIGDSYAGSGGAGGDYNEGGLKSGQPKYAGTAKTMKPSRRRDKEPMPGQYGQGSGLKPKDLMMVPHRIAIALQDDGWYLRSDIVWAKAWMKGSKLEGGAMPGSQTDRPTTGKEYIFLLTKKPRYFFDGDADRADSGAMLRDVWRMNTQGYKEAHFATFPEELPERCIKLGTSEHGVCPECGNAWERVVEKIQTGETQKMADGWDVGEGSHGTIHRNGRSAGETGIPVTKKITTGWRPTCSDYDHLYRSEFPKARNARKRHQQDVAGYWWKRVRQRPGKDRWQIIPATVLDPFIGSGTTVLVARQLGRIGIGLDLSFGYLQQAAERTGEAGLRSWGEGLGTNNKKKEPKEVDSRQMRFV